MREKDLQNGLNHIDDSLLEEALETKPATKRPIRRGVFGVAAAACACIMILGVVQLTNNGATGPVMNLGEGEMYREVEDYGQLYDVLKTQQQARDYGVVYEAEMAVENDGIAADTPKTAEESADLASGTDGSYSRTNVVTEGVDESDIIKTDGNYIYVVNGGSINITDIRCGEPIKVNSLSLPLESPADTILEMYVNSGKLIAIVSNISSDQEKIYCYTYDISNPEDPQLLGSVNQTGSYRTSRLIGDKLYMMTNPRNYGFDMGRFSALKKKNLNKWVPCVNDQPLDCTSIYACDNPSSANLVASFSIDNPTKIIDKKCFFMGYADVYVSTDNMYIYSTDYGYSREVTNIAKLSLTDGKIKEEASTTVAGYVRDAFALNEKDGYLRVLTTSANNGTDSNTLFVLDKDMKQTGRIDGIAYGEQIYAARYVGDLVYFITYKNTDPLFVCDLSNPASPKLLGELEVEGFSEYLHMWDDTHLLGIGYNNGANNSIMLTMFDVSNPLKPEVCHQEEIGNNRSSFAIDYQYKALLVDPARGIIGFPSTDYDENYNVTSLYELFSYDQTGGFQNVLRQKLANDDYNYRGLYSGDNFYVVGLNEIFHNKLK